MSLGKRKKKLEKVVWLYPWTRSWNDALISEGNKRKEKENDALSWSCPYQIVYIGLNFFLQPYQTSWQFEGQKLDWYWVSNFLKELQLKVYYCIYYNIWEPIFSSTCELKQCHVWHFTTLPTDEVLVEVPLITFSTGCAWVNNIQIHT